MNTLETFSFEKMDLELALEFVPAAAAAAADTITCHN